MIVPFDATDDLIGKRVIGMWLNEGSPPTTVEAMVVAQQDKDIKTFRWDTYTEFMEHYLFEDGTPCGKVIEDKE
jgi:hypothetical protein